MPVSVRRSPFPVDPPPGSTTPVTPRPILRTPQARVLASLVPETPDIPRIDWPILTRAKLGIKAGYTAISGSVTRALNGIRPGSSSGDAHLGLLDLGFVEEVVLDIDGTTEVNYRATAAGVGAYREYLSAQGALPELRDPAVCTNERYKKKSENE